MKLETPTDAILVSCDIIGHGRDVDHTRQRARISGLNSCIRQVCGPYFRNGVIWVSGGDGGHIAFFGDDHCEMAVRLISELYLWARTAHEGSGTPELQLRLTAHYGPVSAIEGADGRDELVGAGINLSGSLLAFGTAGAVVVTSPFRNVVKRLKSPDRALLQRAEFHNERTIYLKHHQANTVMDLSLPGMFESVSRPLSQSDKAKLHRAAEEKNAWSTIYHAKRLLQVNSTDREALAALQEISPSQLVIGSGRHGLEAHPLLSQMNRQALQDLIHNAHLVERDDGEIICCQDDAGDTMFIILGGGIGVVADPAEGNGGESAPRSVSFEQGQIVGELALALHRGRTATLQAIGPTALLAVNYKTLQGLLNAKPRNARLERAFNEFLLDRSLRFVCSNSPYLARGETAPLAGTTRPWESLADDSEQFTFSWENAETFFSSRERFSVPGIYVLAGGRVTEASQSEAVAKHLDPHDLPLAFVDLPNAVASHNHVYQVDQAAGSSVVSIVRISERALRSFGPTVYSRLVEAVKRQLASQFVFDAFISYSNRDEHIAVVWREAMERAGLRVYMSRPEAMRKFKNEIELALAESLVMVPFVSDRAVGPEGQEGWVQREIKYRKTLFDEDHCNILPIELTRGLSEAFADGFSAITISGSGEDAVAQAIDAIASVRRGERPPPFSAHRRDRARI